MFLLLFCFSFFLFPKMALGDPNKQTNVHKKWKKNFPPYSLLSDFIPQVGEDKVQDSIYSRWRKKNKNPSSKIIKKFISNNFIVRDGKSWTSQKKHVESRISLEKALNNIMSHDVIFFGEQHNQASDHLLEVFLLQLVQNSHPNTTVFMEMLERQTQPILNQYLKGKLSEKEFIGQLKDPSIRGFWRNYKKDYRPIVETCKKRKIPIICGFPPRKFASILARKGEKVFYETLNPKEKHLVARTIKIPGKGYEKRFWPSFNSMNDVTRTFIFKMIQKSPQKLSRMEKMLHRMGSKKSFQRMFLAQCLKDSTMAEGILDYRKVHPNRKIFVVLGSGHLSYGSGVVDLLRKGDPKLKIVTMTSIYPKVAIFDDKEKEPVSDYIFFTDSIKTYVESYPKGMSKKEWTQKIETMEKLKWLKIYQKNGSNQEKAMRLIEKERNLKFKYPVSCRIMTKEESDKEVVSWSKTEEEKRKEAKKEIFLKSFKLISRKTNLTKTGEKHRKSSILGFYQPTNKYLYIFPSKAKSRTWGLRVHESVHALQDQWFDLEALHKQGISPDQDFALTALIEGEAVYVMMKVLGMGKKMNRMLYGKKRTHGKFPHGKSPHGKSRYGKSARKKRPLTYFRLRTIFFYRKGAQFVKHLVQQGGWKKMNQAFQNPPTTSYEILHPEKFLQGNLSLQIPSISPKKGWKIAQIGDFGEANLFILFRLHGFSSDQAYDLANGWKGDFFRLSQSPTKKNTYHLIYSSSWKSEEKGEVILKRLAKVFPSGKIERKGKVVTVSRIFEIE